MRDKQYEYRVVWEIDVSARNPLEAAEMARTYQNPSTLALVFTAHNQDTKESHDVDLMNLSIREHVRGESGDGIIKRGKP